MVNRTVTLEEDTGKQNIFLHEHKNNCVWIDHIATDNARIDKGLSRILTQYSWLLYGTHHSITSCIGDDQANHKCTLF